MLPLMRIFPVMKAETGFSSPLGERDRRGVVLPRIVASASPASPASSLTEPPSNRIQ